MNKPIDKKTHTIIDFGSTDFCPEITQMNKAALNTYILMGLEVLALNVLTKSPLGLFKRLSFKDHKKADAGFLAGLVL